MSCQCERLDCQFAIQCADNPPPSSSSETFFVQARCEQILKEGETHVVLWNTKQRETSNSQSEKDQRGECIRCSTYTRIQLTAESSIKDHVIRKLLCVCVCVCMWCAFVVYTDIVDPEFWLLCIYRVHPRNSMLYKKSWIDFWWDALRRFRHEHLQCVLHFLHGFVHSNMYQNLKYIIWITTKTVLWCYCSY